MCDSERRIIQGRDMSSCGAPQEQTCSNFEDCTEIQLDRPRFPCESDGTSN